MQSLRKGRYVARFAESSSDILAAQGLRHLCFRGGGGLDADPFDEICRHVLVEDAADGRLLCCFRLMHLNAGCEISRSYSAQYYDLSALEAYDRPMVEMGRFCIHPDVHDPDVLRIAWGLLTRFVDAEDVGMLFGCSSFKGTESDPYLDAFAMLKDGHLAPRRWWPRVKAPSVFRFARRLARRDPDRKRATLTMPPLLRSYLMLGGWVSDHAVVDRDLNTMHVFTGLEIGAIPESRARLLRGVAG
ncbi:MAG: GNAT family N-acetyltransferase [Gemmobacter sp.]